MHCLCLAALVLLCASMAEARRSLTNTARFQKPYNVCTSDWMPMVTCDFKDPSEFDGYQIQLWKDIATDLGWSDSDWSFTCLDWDVMMEDLVNPNGSCSFAAAGVEMSLPNILAGVVFSWPIYKSGLQVLISSHVEVPGTWSFLLAFHWSVWLVIFSTAAAMTLLVTLVEIMIYGFDPKKGPKGAKRMSLRSWGYYIVAKMVQLPTHIGDPKTWAARTLVLGFAFMVLIMVHLFTAATAHKLTSMRLANSIAGREDLPGRKVETWGPYIFMLLKYRIAADEQPWDNADDEAKLIENLRSRAYQALVLDTPAVQAIASAAEECDLYPVDEPFETFDLAIAFPPDIPVDIAQQISASIIRLQSTQARLDELEHIYMRSGGSDGSSGCRSVHTGGGHGDSNPQIQMQQVLGLWYMQFAIWGFALLLTVAHNCVYDPRWRSTCVGQAMRVLFRPCWCRRVAPVDADGRGAKAGSGETAVQAHGHVGDEGTHCVAELTVKGAAAWHGGEPAGQNGGKNAAEAAAIATDAAGPKGLREAAALAKGQQTGSTAIEGGAKLELKPEGTGVEEEDLDAVLRLSSPGTKAAAVGAGSAVGTRQ